MEVKTYYEPLKCFACERQTNAGEAVPVKTSGKVGVDSEGKLVKMPNYVFVCQSCYKKALLISARR